MTREARQQAWEQLRSQLADSQNDWEWALRWESLGVLLSA